MPHNRLPTSSSRAETTKASSKKRKRIIDSSSSSQAAVSRFRSAPHSSLSSAPPEGSPPSSPLVSKRNKARDTPPPSAHSVSTSSSRMYNFSSPSRTERASIDLVMPGPQRRMAKATIVGPHIGAKRIVVRNQKAGQAEIQVQRYYNQVLDKLGPSLDAILRNEKELPSSNEELYQGVRNVCMQGKSSALYTELSERMESYAVTTLKARIRERLLTTPEATKALPHILQEWELWKSQWAIIKPIFQSMATPPNRSLSDLADDLFRSVLDNTLISPMTFNGICGIIFLDRSGTPTDLESASKAVQMMIDLSLYTNHLEPRILADSQEFAAGWASSWSKSEDLPSYVQLVLNLFKSETHRCDTIGLSSATKRDLITLLEEHTIKRQRDSLVDETEVAALLQHNKVQDLEALYSLLGRCELTNDLIPPFENWIKEKGTAIVFDEEHEDDMIVLLLTLRKQVDNVWKVAFHSDKAYAFNIRTAFVDFMNKTKKSAATYNTENSKQGEMIAKYVDLLLKGGSKAIPSSLSKSPVSRNDADEEDNEVQDESEVMNEQLDQVLDLFRFLQGKAVFEAFYKKDLARRLLMGKSASADDEESMLRRLKIECGDAFTHNLETMFKDIELSKEEMTRFEEGQTDSGKPIPTDIYVNVLCSAAWPTYPDLKANIPPSVKESLDMFEKSYKDRHTGRVLIWKHSLAHCYLRAEFPKGRKELGVSGFQAIVLLLFSFTDLEETLSYERISGETGLSEADLKRTLQSLACAKWRPLRKHPQGREINKTDVFSVNKNFEHPKYRVKINQVQLKETKEENKETHTRLQIDRELEIQAAIVRIMKAEKKVGHNSLVAKVIDATKKRGSVPMAELKKQIEKLIMKDYMEREEDGTYSYVG